MKKALLIIDDEPNITRALSRLFRDSGYQIFTATSGQEGLNLLANNDIQVIISDHCMPHMSGSEFLTEVKRIYPDTVRLILSGYADFDIIKDAINDGLIYKFVTKPWDDSTFRQQVHEAFQTYALQNKNKLGKQLLENSLGGVVITTGADEVIHINHAYTIISGLTESEVIGKKFIFYANHKQNPKQHLIKDELNKTGNWCGELWVHGKNSMIFPAKMSITALFDIHHAPVQYTYIIMDISKQKEQEQILAQQIYIDKLTGLNNRFYYSTQLVAAIDYAKQNQFDLAIICIDLDRFGTINQNLGYDAGNYALQQIASRLQQLITEDNILARIGNDEFALILKKYSTNNDLELMLKQISELFIEPVLIGTSTIYISASIGICCYPKDGNNPDLLINCSNLALLASKERGGNTYQFYNDTMVKSDVKQFVLETELHQALKKNQFVVFYQPIISTHSGKIISVEALIRWQHPTKGLLNPDCFLSLCESTGLIIPLTNWMLLQACQQIKKFHELGFPEIFIAVNLSTRQFNDPNLLNLIKEVLEITQIPPQCLEIEITESLSMQDIEVNTKLLQELRDLGLQLALDDFGTGYSSMSYLKQLPFNILKIDQSFINDLSITNNSVAIVQAIIALGRNLGLTIIAEGVETNEQLSILREIKCDLIQGYIFSKPITENELGTLLLKNAQQPNI